MKAKVLAVGLMLALIGPLNADCQGQPQEGCVRGEQSEEVLPNEGRRVILYNPDIYQNSYLKDPVERGLKWPSSHDSSFYDEFAK